MIILDTNVLGELVRPRADQNVVRWLDRQAIDELATTSVTAAEMALGIAQMGDGKRKSELAALNATILGQMVVFSFTELEAASYGLIMAKRQKLGRRIEPLDAQIAAIALSHKAIVATRNVRDFDSCGIDLVDPWTA